MITHVQPPAGDAFGRRRRMLLGSLLAVLPWLAGCADWGYSRIQLGQQLREYDRVFSGEQSRRGEDTLVYLESDRFGRTDAIVLLLTRDRRVAGKLHSTRIERDWGLQTELNYALTGEIDPNLAHFDSTGPVDMLRAIADELSSEEGDKLAREARAWVAAGIVRVLQRWPHVGDEGPALPRVSDMLERIPAGGQARITVDPRGAYVIDYTHVIMRAN